MLLYYYRVISHAGRTLLDLQTDLMESIEPKVVVWLFVRRVHTTTLDCMDSVIDKAILLRACALRSMSCQSTVQVLLEMVVIDLRIGSRLLKFCTNPLLISLFLVSYFLFPISCFRVTTLSSNAFPSLECRETRSGSGDAQYLRVATGSP